ncbi:MAG: tetratricopeptide repeat protein [Candidatus Aegiribacteria sp.]|nr:tetratricopeptide repeat protein [Candidatus Aegiribacteria sp.]
MDASGSVREDGKPPEEIKGERLLQESSYEKAAGFFLQAAENHPAQRSRLYHKAAVAYWKAGVFEKAARIFKAAIRSCRQDGDLADEARNILGLGASYHGLNRMSESYRVMHNALKVAEDSGDLKIVADVTNWLGIICKDQGDFSLAVDHHKKALNLSRKLGNEHDEASSLNSLGLAYYHMESYQRAMECFNEALDIQRSENDSWGFPDTLNSIGMTLRKMDRLEEALEYYIEALEARKRVGGLARTANILNNIGNLCLSMGNTDNAVKYHKEALAIREDISSRSGMALSLFNLGEAWKKEGKLHKSASCLEKSLNYQQNNRPDEIMMDTIRMLSEVRSALGDSAKAYDLSVRALETSRKLYHDLLEKRMMESREILETEHRVREAKLLRSKNRKLENLSDMLSDQKEQLQLILDYVPAVIVFINNEGTVIRLNRYAARLVGKEPMELVGGAAEKFFGSLGRTLKIPPDEECFDTSEPQLNTEETISLKDGDHIFLCHRVPFKGIESTLDGMVVFAIDITEGKKAEGRRKELQELAGKAKRLESLGYLAGSIAHDFNNLLLGIMGNVELVIGRTGNVQSRNNLEKASESARRAASLCDQLLAFSGRGDFISKQFDLSAEVEFILKSITFDPEVHFSFNTTLAEGLPLIDISPSQLRLALKNLLAILEEATIEGEKVDIVTGRVYVNSEYLKEAVQNTDSSEGDYLFMEVSAFSGGISKDEVYRMFDPFTDGDVLKTDLRMPAVQGILKSYGGFMTCRQNENTTGTIRLHFPCSQGSSSVEKYPEPETREMHAGGYIIVVDDEESVRETVESMLNTMGYDVLTCPGGISLLKLLEEKAEDIACVLLDLTMPDMGGHEVLREIAKLYPGMDVVLSSGFSEKMIKESSDNPCLRGFLKKPYTMDELRNMLEKVMR